MKVGRINFTWNLKTIMRRLSQLRIVCILRKLNLNPKVTNITAKVKPRPFIQKTSVCRLQILVKQTNTVQCTQLFSESQTVIVSDFEDGPS